MCRMCFPAGSVVKNLPVNAGGMVSIPGSERSSREGNGYPLQYSCLDNSTHRGTWQVTVHGVVKSLTWLSDFHVHFSIKKKKDKGTKASETKRSGGLPHWWTHGGAEAVAGLGWTWKFCASSVPNLALHISSICSFVFFKISSAINQQ